jgi:hypothetical protein
MKYYQLSITNYQFLKLFTGFGGGLMIRFSVLLFLAVLITNSNTFGNPFSKKMPFGKPIGGPHRTLTATSGWANQLQGIGQYGLYCSDSLIGLFTSFAPSFCRSLTGSYYPSDSLQILSGGVPTSILDDFRYLDSILQPGILPFTNNSSSFSPGNYGAVGDIVISDTLTLNGDSSSLFYFRSNGNIHFTENALLILNGVGPEQVLFSAGENIYFNSFNSFKTGILFSQNRILVGSNTALLSGVFSEGPIEFNPVQGDIVPEVYNALGKTPRVQVACPITLEGNNYNLIQNPGFEIVGTGSGIGGGRLDDLCGWGQFHNITVDVFHDDATSYPNLCPSETNPSTYRIIQSSHSQNPTTPAVLTSGFPNLRYIGMFQSSPVGLIENCFTSLIEAVSPQNFYFFSVQASPATAMGRTSTSIPIFLGHFEQFSLGWDNINLTNGEWTTFSRIFKTDVTINRLHIGRNHNSGSVNNPGSSNCASLNAKSYNFYDNLKLFTIPNPIANLTVTCGLSSPICLVNLAQINVGALTEAGVTFLWRVNNVVVSNVLNYCPIPTQTTTYTLFAVLNGVEQEIESTTITFTNSNLFTINATETICEGNTFSALVIGSASSPPSFQWFKETNGSFGLVQNGGYLFSISNAEPHHSGTYKVIINYASCQEELIFTFTVLPKPIIIGEPINICQGSYPCGIPLIATPSGGSWTGTGVSQNIEGCDPGWVFNATDPDNELDHGLAPGTYSLQYSVTGGNGCTNQALISAIIRPENILNFDLENPTCPGKPLFIYSTVNQIPGAQYSWTITFNVQGTSYSGFTAPSPIFEDVGFCDITFSVFHPNNPDFCPASITKRIEIKNPTVPILSKNYNDPVIVCSDVTQIELETEIEVGATYTWEKVPGIELTPFPNEPHRVLVTLNPVPTPPSSITTVKVTIAPYKGCGQANGTINITRKTNYFSGTPGFWYDNPITGEPTFTSPIQICSGNSVILHPGNTIGYSGPNNITYFWTGPGISSPVQNLLHLQNLEPGTYTYRIQAVENQIDGCGSDYTEVTVIVNDDHNLSISPIAYSSNSSDFDLLATFDFPGVDSWFLTHNGNLIETGVPNSNQHLFNIYSPVQGSSTCRPDGVYSFKIEYLNGCAVRKDFTLVGEKGRTDPPTEYSSNMTLSGKVYMHHNVTFNAGVFSAFTLNQKTLKFINADVFVRGGTGPDELTFQGLMPGTVTGSKLDVKGSASRFLVSNTIFQSVFDFIWGGISVNGIQDLNFGSPGGSPENDVVVRDAYIGLTITGQPIAGSSMIINSRFENDYYGIVSKTSKTPIEPLDNIIKNCFVGCEPIEMKRPYQPRLLAGDIRSFHTQIGVSILGTSEYPMVTYLNQSEPTFTNNQFKNCFIGLYSEINAPNKFVDVRNCAFEGNVFTSVSTLGGVRTMKNCEFVMPQAAENTGNHISMNLSAEPAIGVRAINSGISITESNFSPESNGVFKVTSGFTGIQALAEANTTHTLTLTGNKFTDLNTSIDLQKQGSDHGDAFFDLTLRCNEFEQTAEIPNGQQRIGLRLGEEAAPSGSIGNNGLGNNGNPSGNVWPIDPAILAANPVWMGPGVINNWLSPQGWTSLQNNNPNAVLEYWAYNNEFVWPISNNLQLTRVRTRIQGSEEELMMYRKGTIPPTDDPGVVRYIEQCTEDLPNVFPLPLRQAVHPVTANSPMATENRNSPILGDAIPNPAIDQVQIPVYIPNGFQKNYSISLFDLTGKSILLHIPIYETGQVKISISLKDVPSGVYGYRLQEDGKSLGARKLVILK